MVLESNADIEVCQAIQQILPENAPHPLKRSANSWTPRRLMRLDECSPGEANDRKLRGLLNKLTSPNFNSISHQITLLINKSENEKDGRSVRQAINLILEATHQSWSLA
ncbi:hypothetical protein PGTUg99_000331 [Puccinia graminis f. sp. tritici]|uniref:Uncharacterized protein n=1 Tax=Puccinia graminis f. sp. tritici TaxID=56615 RepID=A0A5B0RAC0_PUCGR|nr:hypothetical protein PGTUg99_000331 [Puccinia graminis f. sp. tritici]